MKISLSIEWNQSLMCFSYYFDSSIYSLNYSLIFCLYMKVLEFYLKPLLAIFLILNILISLIFERNIVQNRCFILIHYSYFFQTYLCLSNLNSHHFKKHQVRNCFLCLHLRFILLWMKNQTFIFHLFQMSLAKTNFFYEDQIYYEFFVIQKSICFNLIPKYLLCCCVIMNFFSSLFLPKLD